MSQGNVLFCLGFGSHCPSKRSRNGWRNECLGSEREKNPKRRKRARRCLRCCIHMILSHLTLSTVAWQQDIHNGFSQLSQASFVAFLYGSTRWQTFVVILGMMIENVRRITCEYVLPSIMWWKFPFTAFIRSKEKQNEVTEKKSKQRRMTGKR